jgi:hypothetical protein
VLLPRGELALGGAFVGVWRTSNILNTAAAVVVAPLLLVVAVEDLPAAAAAIFVPPAYAAAEAINCVIDKLITGAAALGNRKPSVSRRPIRPNALPPPPLPPLFVGPLLALPLVVADASMRKKVEYDRGRPSASM